MGPIIQRRLTEQKVNETQVKIIKTIFWHIQKKIHYLRNQKSPLNMKTETGEYQKDKKQKDGKTEETEDGAGR